MRPGHSVYPRNPGSHSILAWNLDMVLHVLNGGMEEEEEIILDLWLSMVVSSEALGRGVWQ